MERLKAGPPFTCPFACANPVMDRMGIRDFSLCLRSVPRLFYVDELKIIQPAVSAELLHQLFVAAYIRDRSVFENYDAVRATHRRKPMSDDNDCTAGHQVVQRRLDQRLGFAIKRGGGFVEDENGRILQKSAGNGDALTFASGETYALFADFSLISGGKFTYEIVRQSCAGGGFNFCLRNPGLTVSDIV